MPQDIEPDGFPSNLPDNISDDDADNSVATVNYSRKVVDIIEANDHRWYMMLSDAKWKILLDITENLNRQRDLALVSLIVLSVIALTGYRISRLLVARGLKDLYRLAERVQHADIENLHTPLLMDHLPADDEINIVAGAVDRMKNKIHDQVQSIKDFVSHVSHEFKTPLMIMRSDIDLAKKTKEYDELIEKNMHTVEQMQTLLDGLLVLTMAQTGKLTVAEINMSSLLERVCENMEKKYDGKDVIVHKHISPHVFIDTHQWAAESVISNILDNAYKYTPEWENIILTLTETECVIADTGMGISDEQREKIRQPFRQADKTRQDGVGLGLSIVQKLSEVLWWKVKVEKNEEKWTKVTLLFPQI